jgi:hypothetical protein
VIPSDFLLQDRPGDLERIDRGADIVRPHYIRPALNCQHCSGETGRQALANGTSSEFTEGPFSR